MRSPLSTAILWCLSALVALPLAEETAVFPAYVTNLTPEEGQAIGAVMAQAYGEVTGKSVAGPPTTNAGEAQPGDEPEQTAALGATEYVVLNAVRLQDRIMLEARLHRADGSLVHQARMTGVTMDDLVAVCDRLARAIHFRTTVAKTRTQDNIVRSEAEPENRVPMERVVGMKTSALYSIYSGRAEPMAAIGFHMKLEGDRHFLELGAGVLSPAFTGYDYSRPRYGGISVDVGWAWYATGNDMATPFIGAGLSPRVMINPGGIAAAPYAQVGLMLFRRSTTRFFVGLRVAQNALPITYDRETEVDYVYDNNSYYGSSTRVERVVREEQKVYPTEISIDIGIGW